MSTGNGNGDEGRGAPQMARMPWYPRDFSSSTRGWPLVARAVYRELLDAQWDIGSLPNNLEALRAMAGATVREWRIAWPQIGPKLPIGQDGRRRNPRLEEHRERAVVLLERQRAGGVKGNEARWGSR